MMRRGNYYATANTRRSDGVRQDHQTARQARTLAAACRSVDAFDHAERTGQGFVQLWVELEQRRYVVAERDEAGNWWALSPYGGSLRAIDQEGSNG